MGFQDRGYYRERYTPSFAPEWTAVMTIIIVNIGLWVANLVAAGEIPITAFLALKGNLFERPWDLWQLVTYGFVHDPTSPMHVFVNMLALFFFGREVEAVLGRERFVRFYLIAIVIAGLAWLASLRIEGMRATLVGASGGVAAVIAMFIWYFPRQTVLIYGILPVPAWAFGLLYFFSDLQGAAGGGGRVAHVAHIGAPSSAALRMAGGQLENLTRRIAARPPGDGFAAGPMCGSFGDRTTETGPTTPNTRSSRPTSTGSSKRSAAPESRRSLPRSERRSPTPAGGSRNGCGSTRSGLSDRACRRRRPRLSALAGVHRPR